MSYRSPRANLDLLVKTKEDLKTAINFQGGSINSSTPLSEYADQIDDISVGDGINWVLIGFDSEPEEIIKGYDYAKYMVDHKSEFPGIGTNKLDVSNNSSLIYLPSCDKLGVDKNDISVFSFLNCKNLVYINDKELHTQKVKFNSSTFKNCISLKYIPKLDISTYTSNGTVGLFLDLKSLETIDPSNNTLYWYSTHNLLKGFSYLFYGCNSLKTLPVIDCGKLPEGNRCIKYMFFGCNSLTDVSIINTSTVTDMSYMFYECTSLTTVPLFDTQNVSTMLHMCYSCTSLMTVPMLDTQNVTNMLLIFYNCTALTTVEGLDFRSISSEANSRLLGTSNTNISLRKLYIKNIGYSACTTYDFIRIQNWGINNSSIPDASLSIYKSLVEDTSNRAAAGSSTVNIKLYSTSLNTLDNTAKAAICAKGYTLNGTTY